MKNADVARKFYESFQKKDAQAMAACYADDVVFSDPVFPELKGNDARDMWRMLCVTGKDLKIEFSLIGAENLAPHDIRVRWDAYYLFSKTGRKVHNVVSATLTFKDGKIIRHKDEFSFWHWSRQALGPAGLLLGWTPVMLKKVRAGAAESLKKFQSK